MADKAKFLSDGTMLPREHLIESIIPTEMYEDYASAWGDGRKFYTCVSVGFEKPKLFFEPSFDDNLKQREIRVFWKKDEARKYMNYLKSLNSTNKNLKLSLWEVSIDNLVKSLIKTCAGSNQNYQYIAFASVYVGGYIQDIDFFWQYNKTNTL